MSARDPFFTSEIVLLLKLEVTETVILKRTYYLYKKRYGMAGCMYSTDGTDANACVLYVENKRTLYGTKLLVDP